MTTRPAFLVARADCCVLERTERPGANDELRHRLALLLFTDAGAKAVAWGASEAAMAAE